MPLPADVPGPRLSGATALPFPDPSSLLRRTCRKCPGNWASGLPCSADMRYQRAASSTSFSTLPPNVYMVPRAICAVRSAASAASWMRAAPRSRVAGFRQQVAALVKLAGPVHAHPAARAVGSGGACRSRGPFLRTRPVSERSDLPFLFARAHCSSLAAPARQIQLNDSSILLPSLRSICALCASLGTPIPFSQSRAITVYPLG